MKIALVCRREPPLRVNESGPTLSTLAAGLAGLGHGVHLITENRFASRPSLSVHGLLRVHRLNVAGGVGTDIRPERNALDFSVEAARALRRLADREGLDLVEFADGDAAAAWLLARALAPRAGGRARPILTIVPCALYVPDAAVPDAKGSASLHAITAACAGLADSTDVHADDADPAAVAAEYARLIQSGAHAASVGGPARLAAWRALRRLASGEELVVSTGLRARTLERVEAAEANA